MDISNVTSEDSKKSKTDKKSESHVQNKKNPVDTEKPIPIFKLTLKIPGTDWLVVMPSDGKSFYYNEVKKISTYTQHPDIKERNDIDDIKERLKVYIFSSQY